MELTVGTARKGYVLPFPRFFYNLKKIDFWFRANGGYGKADARMQTFWPRNNRVSVKSEVHMQTLLQHKVYGKAEVHIETCFQHF